MQPLRGIPEHLPDVGMPGERPAIDLELPIGGEKLHAAVDVARVEGQRVLGEHLTDRRLGLVILGHCSPAPRASRRCSAAPRLKACDSAASVIIRNPRCAMARPVLPSLAWIPV